MNFAKAVFATVSHRISVFNQLNRNISTTSILLFRPTACLFGEPLKKKKKMDPAIIRAREERKKKKLEKQIRKLEKTARQLKPIDECEVPINILEKRSLYARPVAPESETNLDKMVALEKQWAKYKRDEHFSDIQLLDRIAYSQQRALDELKLESEELYQEAIQIDFTLLPLKFKGPTSTPPIKDYDSPDGEYLDVSKKW